MTHMLAAAVASGNVVYHELLLCYSAGERVVYGIVEGKEDPSFYRGAIDQLLPENWAVKLIRAGRKTAVLEAYDAMDWARFPKKRICFFVDRDLSDFCGGETHAGENLFVTEGYSIECYVANPLTLHRVLEEVLNVSQLTPAEMVAITSLFEKNLADFREAMVPIMSQIVIWRRLKSNVSLDNISPKEMFQFSNGVLQLKPAFSLATQRLVRASECVNAALASDADLQKLRGNFVLKMVPKKQLAENMFFGFSLNSQ